METFAAEARLEFFCIEMGVSLERDSARSQSQEAFSDNRPHNQCKMGVSIDVICFNYDCT